MSLMASLGELEEAFIAFKSSLNKKEREAIQGWLNMQQQEICVYQRTGKGSKYIAEIEPYLHSALLKAVPCRRTVYRGLSDQFRCPQRQKHMRELLDGPEIITFNSHASANLSEEIGEAFTFTELDDEDRTLSVLLQISSKTGRYLYPFRHEAEDEFEVVLLRGSKYRRMCAKRQADPKPNLEYWIIQLEESIQQY